MKFEIFEVECRRTFEAQGDQAPLVKEFASLTGEERIAAWTFLTRKGIEDVDFIKWVHGNFSRLVLEVFGTPVSKKVT